MYAVEQFDKDKPYKFTTYLNYALKHVVRRLLNNKDVLSQAGTMQFDQPIGEDKDGGELLLSDIVPIDFGKATCTKEIYFVFRNQ